MIKKHSAHVYFFFLTNQNASTGENKFFKHIVNLFYFIFKLLTITFDSCIFSSFSDYKFENKVRSWFMNHVSLQIVAWEVKSFNLAEDGYNSARCVRRLQLRSVCKKLN